MSPRCHLGISHLSVVRACVLPLFLWAAGCLHAGETLERERARHEQGGPQAHCNRTSAHAAESSFACWRCEISGWKRETQHTAESPTASARQQTRPVVRLASVSLESLPLRRSEAAPVGEASWVETGAGVHLDASPEIAESPKIHHSSWHLSYTWLRNPRFRQEEPEPDRIAQSPAYQSNWGEWEWNTTFAVAIEPRWKRMPVTDPRAPSHRLFCVAENIERTTLVPEPHPMEHDVFHRTRVSLGYLYQLRRSRLGVGASGSAHLLARPVEQSAARMPLSFLVFTRWKL
jgi:hypothetical protein